MALLTVVVQVAQESTSLEATLNPIAKAFGESFAADRCILQLVESNILVANQGSYSI